MILNNTAEGGTNTTTITQGVGGNTGGASGDFFDSVTIGAGSALTFDNGFARGSFAYKMVPASGQQNFFEWNTQMGSVSTAYGRLYLYFDTSPNTGQILLFRSGATQCCRIQLDGVPTLRWRDASTVDIPGAISATLSIQTWYRVEYKVIFSATVGQVFLNYYIGDSTSAVETLSSTASFNLGASFADSLRMGRPVAVANTTTLYFDDIQLNDTGFPGPSTTGHSFGATVGELTPTSGAISFGGGDSM